MKSKNSKHLPFLIIPALLIVIFTLISARAFQNNDALIVYCSHDSVFADDIFRKFTAETGIKVIPRYDTEASKSLGLTEKILREGKNSDCDVYWSNEMFSMSALLEDDLLTPYKGPGWQRIPENFKDEQGLWSGFAARMRLIIYNTENTPQEPMDFSQSDLAKTSIALPLYGTTLTHFALLQNQLGPETLKKQYNSWRQRGAQIVPGNGPARNLVANGNCSYAWTDTDDYFGAVDQNKPVNMKPCTLPNGKYIIIPNTVGILKSTDKLNKAQVFADYLLSEKNELVLAKSSSRQIPLGETSAELPPEVSELQKYIANGADLKAIFKERASLIKWLKAEHQLP